MAHLASTWSHNISNTVGPNSVQYPPMNSLCITCDWGPVNEDRRHMLIISHVYELPFGAGRPLVNHGVISQIVGGWDISGTWALYSGMHNNPVMSLPWQIYQARNIPAVSAMSARMLLQAAIPTWCPVASRDSKGSIRLATRF